MPVVEHHNKNVEERLKQKLGDAIFSFCVFGSIFVLFYILPHTCEPNLNPCDIVQDCIKLNDRTGKCLKYNSPHVYNEKYCKRKQIKKVK